MKIYVFFTLKYHNRPKILKKYGPKKLVKSNKIFRQFQTFPQFKNLFLAIFEIAKNRIWPKKIHEINLFDFMSFFGLDFFNFLAYCGSAGNEQKNCMLLLALAYSCLAKYDYICRQESHKHVYCNRFCESQNEIIYVVLFLKPLIAACRLQQPRYLPTSYAAVVSNKF